METAWPFTIGSKAFYPGTRSDYKVLCQSQDAYLFFVSSDDKKTNLWIVKRSLTDFHHIWTGSIVMGAELATNPVFLFLESVQESETGLRIKVLNEDVGTQTVWDVPTAGTR